MLINVVLLVKSEESPIGLQIGLEQSLFIARVVLCTPPTIFLSFTPHDMAITFSLIPEPNLMSLKVIALSGSFKEEVFNSHIILLSIFFSTE